MQSTMPDVMLRKSPSGEYVFNSNVPQRFKPGKLQGQEDSTTNLVGPGAYNITPTGQPFRPGEWIVEPKRKQSSFASKTVKSPMERPLTADIDIGKDYAITLRVRIAAGAYALALALTLPTRRLSSRG